MRIKYRVSNRDVYIGPISRMPYTVFENLEFSVDPAFLHQLSAIDRRDSNRSGTQNTQRVNRNSNVDNEQFFSRSGYDVKLVSKKKGYVKLHAGHMKHTFHTYGRPIMVRILKGEMKVKCNVGQYKMAADTAIQLNPNTVYYVKNNSLRNECIFRFVFEERN